MKKDVLTPLRWKDLKILWVSWTAHTHTHLTALFLGLPGWASKRKVKTNLDFTEARDSEWQWNPLGHMQVCTSLQTDNHTSTPPLSFFYRPDALPAAQPTVSKHWRHCLVTGGKLISLSCLETWWQPLYVLLHAALQTIVVTYVTPVEIVCILCAYPTVYA